MDPTALTEAERQQQEQLARFIEERVQSQVGPALNAALAAAEATRLARDIVRPKIIKPEAFTGNRDRESVEQWLFLSDGFLAASGVTDDLNRITIMSTYLRGPALAWWRRVSTLAPPERPTTWADFGTQLLRTFQPINPAENARDRLARLHQTGSVRAYGTLMRNAALEIPDITDAELKDRFIRGLKKETMKDVRMRAPSSFEQAVQLAERYDSMLYTNPRNHAIPFGSGPGPAPMELGAITDNRRSYHTTNPNQSHGGSRPKLTPEMRNQLIRDGKCFYCRNPGHLALDCAERKRDLARRG